MWDSLVGKKVSLAKIIRKIGKFMQRLLKCCLNLLWPSIMSALWEEAIQSPQRHQRFANHKEKTLLKQSHTSRPTGSNPPDAKSMWLDTTGGKTHSSSNYTAHEHSCHLSLLHKPRLTRVIIGKSDRLWFELIRGVHWIKLDFELDGMMC